MRTSSSPLLFEELDVLLCDDVVAIHQAAFSHFSTLMVDRVWWQFMQTCYAAFGTSTPVFWPSKLTEVAQ